MTMRQRLAERTAKVNAEVRKELSRATPTHLKPTNPKVLEAAGEYQKLKNGSEKGSNR